LREGQADLVEQQQALASAMVALPALIAAQMKSGDPLSIAGEVTAAEINSTLKGSPQPIEGQVALPSDVVNAIGSAVNAAIRGGGALPVPAGPRPQFPPGTPVDFPVSVTLADATERRVEREQADVSASAASIRSNSAGSAGGRSGGPIRCHTAPASARTRRTSRPRRACSKAPSGHP
jgi:hypothetical protein